LEQEIYMDQHDGFVVEGQEGKVLSYWSLCIA
jgi:hypothetical protein